MFTSSHFVRLVPVVFSFAAFLLGMLALFAGNKPGVLEGYDIITVYTTDLGKNLDNTVTSKTLIPTRTTDGDCEGVGSLLGQACSSMNSAAANALPPPPPPVDDGGRGGSGPNSGNNDDITDGVVEKPHTRDFYSLYTLSICEGEYTADGSRMAQCHPYFSGTSTIPALLGTTVTPHTAVARANGNTALTNGGLTYSLESALNGLDTLLKAVAVLWSLGIGFTGITFFASIPAVSLNSQDAGYRYTWAVWLNLVFTSTAMFFLILGGMVAAAGAKTAEGNVNNMGVGIGVSAVAGTNWIVLAWAGVALLAVTLVYWTWRAVMLRRDKKMRRAAEEGRREGEAAAARARVAELEEEVEMLEEGSQQGGQRR